MGLKETILDALTQATDATRSFAGKTADTTRDIAGKAAVKAKAGGRMATLALQISREKDEMQKTFVEIGKLYYETHKDNPEGFFSQLCEEVALAEKTIAAKEAELTELKTGFSAEKEPDVEVEFEEIVGQAEAEAEGCCSDAADAVEDAKCCCADAADAVEDAVEDAKCCCADAADAVEDAVEDAKCCCADAADAVEDAVADAAEDAADEAKCCGKKLDGAAESVKEFAEKAIDAIAETAEQVKETLEEKFKGGD